MTKKEYIDYGHWIPFRTDLAKRFGGHEFSLLLGLMMAESEIRKHGWFYLTQKRIKEELYLGEKYQDKAIAHFIEIGVIYCKLDGFPQRKWYKIGDLKELLESNADLKFKPKKKATVSTIVLPCEHYSQAL